MVLVVGGQTSDSSAALASAERYNPASNSWSSAGNMSVGRSEFTATLLPTGKVLVAGGEAGVGPTLVGLASAELYDPLAIPGLRRPAWAPPGIITRQCSCPRARYW